MFPATKAVHPERLKYEPKKISAELLAALLKMEEIVVEKLLTIKSRKTVKGYQPGLKMLGEMIMEGKRQQTI